MAITNSYIGLKYGDALNVNLVTFGSATAGASVDVELRIQTDSTVAPPVRRIEVLKCLEIIEAFIESGGRNHAGTNLPV